MNMHAIAVPNLEAGPPPWRPRRPRRETCDVCEKPLRGRQTQRHSDDRACVLKGKALDEARRRQVKPPRARVGRTCRDCLATDAEVGMALQDQCDACSRRQARYGRCKNPRPGGSPGEECKTLLVGRAMQNSDAGGEPFCPVCDPPLYWIEVLWQCEDGRLRRLFRPIRDGRVTMGGKSFVVKSNPLRLIRPVETWAGVRT